MVAAGCRDGSLFIWDVPSGRLRNHLIARRAPIDRVLFAGSSGTVVTLDRALRCWDVNTGALKWVNKSINTLTPSVYLSPDEQDLIVADGDVRRWSCSTGALDKVLVEQGHWQLAVPDARLQACLCVDAWGRSAVFDLRTGVKTRYFIVPDRERVWDVFVDRSGNRVLLLYRSNRDGSKLHCWDPNDWSPLFQIEPARLPEYVGAVAVSPDGKFALCAGGTSGRAVVQFWNGTTGRLEHTVECDGSYVRDGYSPATSVTE